MSQITEGKYYQIQAVNRHGKLVKFFLIADSYSRALQQSRLPQTMTEQEHLQFFIKTYSYLRLSFEFTNEDQVKEFRWQFESAVREALVRVFYVHYNSERRDVEWDVETMVIDLIEELFFKQISK